MHALRVAVLRTCCVSTPASVIFQVLSQMHCHHAWLLCHLITGGQTHRLLQLSTVAMHRLLALPLRVHRSSIYRAFMLLSVIYLAQ